jgi:hypothetical protein
VAVRVPFRAEVPVTRTVAVAPAVNGPIEQLTFSAEIVQPARSTLNPETVPVSWVTSERFERVWASTRDLYE